jgi:hypothetical protein
MESDTGMEEEVLDEAVTGSSNLPSTSVTMGTEAKKEAEEEDEVHDSTDLEEISFFKQLSPMADEKLKS